MHLVAVLALPRVVLFDLAIPTQLFGRTMRDFPGRTDHDRYEVRVCAVEPGPVPTNAGVPLVAEHGLAGLAAADTVVVPGFGGITEPVPPAVRTALRSVHARGGRIASICTGAFALADAGLLDGRRAVTHWAHADLLAERFPAVRVDPDVLYVDEGPVLTSAGLAAGIDMCLHLVRRDLGVAAANHAARRMVVPPHRDGGQAQFIERPVPGRPGDDLAALRRHLTERLAEPHSLSSMAVHARMSARTLTRRFRAETGLSPTRWLLEQRVHRARELLEATDLPIATVAHRCGFGSPLALREQFARRTGTTPGRYRAAFGADR
ncbi:MAG TPA: helix-turn-helix domain-containing protein [Actinocatenispora sp.]